MLENLAIALLTTEDRKDKNWVKDEDKIIQVLIRMGELSLEKAGIEVE